MSCACVGVLLLPHGLGVPSAWGPWWEERNWVPKRITLSRNHLVSIHEAFLEPSSGPLPAFSALGIACPGNKMLFLIGQVGGEGLGEPRMGWQLTPKNRSFSS